MFQTRTESFGEYTQVILENLETGAFFSCIPERGAQLNDLKLCKDGSSHSLLWSAPTVANFKSQSIPYFSGSLLFPFPNRIAGGQYSFDGVTYQFPINDNAGSNALHGLVYDQLFTMEETVMEDAFAKAVFSYSPTQPHSSFPFRYKIRVTYTLSNSTLEVALEVQNLDKKHFPFGIGMHPYIATGTPIDQLEIKLPEVSRFEVNDTMIPTGKMIPEGRMSNRSRIENRTFDDCYAFKNRQENAVTSIYDPLKDLHIRMDQDQLAGKLDYVQIFTPDNRLSIAIEPTTCAPNAFNNGIGLIVLKPQQQHTATFSITLS